MLVVGRDERDQRHVVLLQQPDHFEPVELRHLQIENGQIWLQSFDCFQRRRAVLGCRDQFYVVKRGQHRRQKGTSGPLVISDEHSEAFAHVSAPCREKWWCPRRPAGGWPPQSPSARS